MVNADLFGFELPPAFSGKGNDCLRQGKIQEFVACSHLALAGLSVHLVGDAVGYDLVVDDAGTLHRVNVKSSKKLTSSGAAVVFSAKVGRGGLKSTARAITNECDFLALVMAGCPFPHYAKPSGSMNLVIPKALFCERRALQSLLECLGR